MCAGSFDKVCSRRNPWRMRRTAASFLLGTFVLFALPGMTEVIENLVHLVEAGHTAHAVDTDDHHADAGDEHGCTGSYHLCSCCTSLPACAAVASVTPRLGSATPSHAPDHPDQIGSGFVREIERPPTA